METRKTPRGLIDFWIPSDTRWPVIVSRKLPDKSTEVIGQIYQQVNDDDDSVIYKSINKNGDEIAPPTEDYSEAESCFEIYAQHLSKQIQEEDLEKRITELAERTSEIKKVRQCQNFKSLQLNK